MKNYLIIIFISIISLFLYNCNKNKNIDYYIDKYSNEDFSRLKNVAITKRNETFIKATYLVGNRNNSPTYIVKYNKFRKRVTEIDKSLLEKNNIPDYFTKQEIINFIFIIRNYDFCYLGVDNENNVCFSPDTYCDYPLLLRMNPNISDSLNKPGYVFKKYKENWYVNVKYYNKKP